MFALYLQQLTHADVAIRQQGLSALLQAGPLGIPTLLEALQHGEPKLKRSIAQVLGQLQAQDAIPALIECLHDSDIGTWSQALAALAQIGSAASAPLQATLNGPHAQAKLGAALALWRIQRHEPAFRWVLQAIQNDEVVIRSSAITSLWLQPDARAIATLTMQLNAEPHAIVQSYLLQALKFIDTPQAQAVITRWQNR